MPNMAKEIKIKEKFLNRRNFKARNNIKTKIDTSQQKKIKLDLKHDDSLPYDASNALVLPSKKRATKKITGAAPIKILSKKQRKRLEKIVSTKEKKAQHSTLLEALEAIHSNNKKMPTLTSLQATQTVGRKKYLSADYEAEMVTALTSNKGSVAVAGARQLGCNTISSTAKRKRKEAAIETANKRRPLRDPSIVYASPSSSETSSCSESEDEITEVKQESSEVKQESSEVKEESNEIELKTSDTIIINATTETNGDTNVCSSVANRVEPPVAVTIKPEDYLPSKFVTIKRKPEFEEARHNLPILSEEQTVVEAIRENMMVVIVGPTGSGKTTQVPQFLYEAGYASGKKIIGVTEPRRVAARAMAERVGKEMNLSADVVSYQMRFEGNVTPETKIKFMTDGVLLKEFQSDHSLSKYSALIIDEAHERSVFSDLLIGILSRIVPARHKKGNPLKLIIMSATLRVEDFTENAWLFKKLGAPPPLLKIEGRMFEVTVHYNKKTPDDYVAAAFTKVCKIHRQLPEGAILVFLTGQKEIDALMRKLNATFPSSASGSTAPAVSAYRARKEKLRKKRIERKENQQNTKTVIEESDNSKADSIVKQLLEIKVDDFAAAASVFPDHEGEMTDFLEDTCGNGNENSDDDFELDDDEVNSSGVFIGGGNKNAAEQPLYVLPLFSQLEANDQIKVFKPPPPGSRLCVVATNVAETSLTIPDVKYVVDSGKTKDKVFDKVTGVSMFHVTNCSQASANQRAGRAGRVAPGHCYRLFSSAVFNEFQKFDKPEILCRPIDDVILILKNLGMPVVNFPYPTPPNHIQIRESLKRMTLLEGLLEQDLEGGVTRQPRIHNEDAGEKKLEKDTTKITPLGRLMTSFPVAPRYAKMLCLSDQFSLWPYTIALVAALTVQEVLVEMPLDSAGDTLDQQRSAVRKTRLQWSGTGQRRLLGDLMILLRGVMEAENNNNSQAFCEANGLRRKGLINIRKLRLYLTKEVNRIVPDANVPVGANNRSLPPLKPPTKEQCCALRQVVLSGSVDRVARRVDTAHLKDAEEKIRWKHAYRTVDLEDPVYLPASSVLKIDKPEWVAYQDIFETHKMFMRGVVAIEPEWLGRFAPLLCNFAPPLGKPAPFYDAEKDAVMCYREATYGRADWTVPRCLVAHPVGEDLYGRFAYHLLRGDVIKGLEPLRDYLIDHYSLVRPLAMRNLKQREPLIRALKIHGVSSRAKLLKIWAVEPKYLLPQYLLWLDDSSHTPLVKRMWPPLPKDENEWLA